MAKHAKRQTSHKQARKESLQPQLDKLSSLSADFQELAERFRNTHASNPTDGFSEIEAAGAWGAKLLRRAVDDQG